MQTVKFVTKENDKAICWCTTNDLVTFRDFIQYILDNTNNPHDFMIIDTKKDLVYDFYRVATEQYDMRKRTFEERMNGVQTGKWSKYTKEELKVLVKQFGEAALRFKKAGGDQCNISKGNMIICVKFQKQQRCKICCYSLGDKAHITGSFGFLVIWHDWFSFFSSLKKIFVLLDYIIFKCVFHWIIYDFCCTIS